VGNANNQVWSIIRKSRGIYKMNKSDLGVLDISRRLDVIIVGVDYQGI
jgi:hypothetical protein